MQRQQKKNVFYVTYHLKIPLHGWISILQFDRSLTCAASEGWPLVNEDNIKKFNCKWNMQIHLNLLSFKALTQTWLNLQHISDDNCCSCCLSMKTSLRSAVLVNVLINKDRKLERSNFSSKPNQTKFFYPFVQPYYNRNFNFSSFIHRHENCICNSPFGNNSLSTTTSRPRFFSSVDQII